MSTGTPIDASRTAEKFIARALWRQYDRTSFELRSMLQIASALVVRRIVLFSKYVAIPSTAFGEREWKPVCSENAEVGLEVA